MLRFRARREHDELPRLAEFVRRVGGIDAAITKAQRVVIHTPEGPVTGVVGNVAPHLTKVDKERRVPEMHDLFIDIGVSSRKEARKLSMIVGMAFTRLMIPPAATAPAPM